VLALTLAAIVPACSSDGEAHSPSTQILISVVRDAAHELPPGDDPEELPIVYVVSSTDEKFPADVQAAVASAVNGEVVVRFADARSEAIDPEAAGAPVRDDGGLVAVGEVATDTDPVEVEIEIYQSETQFSRRVVTFSADGGDEWSATSSSVLEEEDVPPASSVDGESGGRGVGGGVAAVPSGTAP
jgi:hypothetical protein